MIIFGKHLPYCKYYRYVVAHGRKTSIQQEDTGLYNIMVQLGDDDSRPFKSNSDP
jgi:hypothetical protein